MLSRFRDFVIEVESFGGICWGLWIVVRPNYRSLALA
jgi:hypothetical protein